MTKICRPDVSGGCVRTRPEDALSSALGSSLSWIVSPAGAGKTYLVASYLGRSKRPTVWLHLDDGDQDVATFFHYLAQAAHVVKRRLALPPLLPEFRDGLQAFSRRFFRALFEALPRGCVLVLDNYEKISNDHALHGLLAAAVEETPGELAWTILSRSAPPPPFLALHAKGRVQILDWETVRFDPAECRDLVRCLVGATFTITKDLALTLAEPDGWAAGLVLAVESAKRDGDSPRMGPGNDEATFAFLEQEMFTPLPADEQHFLLRTAFITELSAADGEKLSGIRARGLLERFASRNLFTYRLSGESFRRGGTSFRYHPLFRRFLSAKAERTLGLEELRTTKLATAELLSVRGQVVEAAGLLRDLAAWERLARLLCESAEELMTQGRHDVLNAWLSTLPSEQLDRPTRAWSLYFRACARLPFEPRDAQPIFAQALSLFRELGDAKGIYLSWSGGTESLLYGWSSFEDYDAWLTALDDIQALHKPPTLAIQGRLAATVYGALVFRRPLDPQLPYWEKRVRGFLRMSRVLEPEHSVLLAINLYHHDLWRGRTLKASTLLDSLRSAVNSARVGPVAVLAYHTMRALHGHFTGDGRSTIEAVNEGLAYAQSSGVHFWDFLLAVQGAFGAIVLGDLELAERYLEDAKALRQTDRHLESLLFHDAAAQLCLARKQEVHALEHARQAVNYAVWLGGLIPEAILRVGLSQALAQNGLYSEALEELERAEKDIVTLQSSVLIARCHLARAQYYFELERGAEAKESLALGLSLCRSEAHYGSPWWRRDVIAKLCHHALSERIEPDFVRQLIARHDFVAPEGVCRETQWAWPVRVYTLCSSFRVYLGEAQLSFSGRAQLKPLELLQAVVALGPTDVPENRLADALWPDSDADAAIQAVATTLHRLRKLVGPDVVIRRDQKIGLDLRRCWLDFAECERCWRSTDLEEVAAGLELYAGSFLAGADQPWLLARREQVSVGFVRALRACARSIESQADGQLGGLSSREWFERGLSVEPGNEALYFDYMSMLRGRGQDAEARDVYRRCVENLRRHHDSAPASATRRLAEGQPGPPAPLRGGATYS